MSDPEWQVEMNEHEQMMALGLPCAFQSANKTKRNKRQKVQTVKRSSSSKNSRKLLSLFRKYPEFQELGISIDDEMIYSITPEVVAAKIAKYCKNKVDYTVLIDGFVGVGGNLIQFAIANPNAFIIGIDTNFERLTTARKIAELYNVAHRCEFICGSFLESSLYIQFKPDIVFLSPPWGGKGYKWIENYKLSDLDIDGYKAFQVASELSSNIVYYLPIRTDDDDLKKLQADYSRMKNEGYSLATTLCVYFGDLIDKSSIIRNSKHLEDKENLGNKENLKEMFNQIKKNLDLSFSTASSIYNDSDNSSDGHLASFNSTISSFTSDSDLDIEHLPVNIKKAMIDKCDIA